MKIPKRINPCPIIDSVVELRFESEFPTDAIFGVIFAAVKNDYGKFQKLPVSDVPEVIRNQDLNLKYAPYFQAGDSNFVLRIGPRVIALSNIEEYVGWEKFFLKLKDILEKLRSTGAVNKFLRLGIRYIDFFEKMDVFENVNLAISEIEIDNKPLAAKQKIFRAVVKNDKFLTNIQLINNTSISIKKNTKNGSLIDSDTFFESSAGFGFAGIYDLINECHVKEHEIFFSLLKKVFLETLNPEY
jgi:uncharacterized protein (TIGR04255 family)